jgi:hypothetical protein
MAASAVSTSLRSGVVTTDWLNGPGGVVATVLLGTAAVVAVLAVVAGVAPWPQAPTAMARTAMPVLSVRVTP